MFNCGYCHNVRTVTSSVSFTVAGVWHRETIIRHCPQCRPVPNEHARIITQKTEQL